jgi:hypothetical protein
MSNEKKLSDEKRKIIQVLERFQEGYTERDTSILDGYADELFTADIFIIGTGASEWPNGINEVKKLIKSDWEHWGYLKINVEDAIVSTHNDVAWFAVQGTLTYKFDSEEYIFQRYGIRDIRRILDQNKSNKLKLIEIVQDASDLLREVELTGTQFVYPIRVAGSLLKEKGKWKFKQMVFSYPYPRNLILKDEAK